MNAKSKIPAIRFEGFSGEWEEKTLEELFSFKNGINATKNQYGKGLKFINVLDIINNNFITHKNIIGLVDISNDVFERNKVEYGDILFQRSSETREEVGQSNVYLDKEKSAAFGGFVIRGKKISDYDPVFVNFLLKTGDVRKEITTRSGGSTRYNVGQDTLKRVPIYISIEQEQTKIGNYFQQLDTLIAQHQKKHDKLLNLKKALLEKLFPKQGTTEPEIRFKGFSGEWAEKALGKYTNFRRGSFPQPYGNKEWYGGEGAMPFVQVVDVTKKLTLVKETKQKISIIAQPKSVFVPKGKVLVTLQGSIGRVAIAQYDTYVDRTLLIFESFKKKTNSHYWAYLIQNKFDIEKKKAPGGTIKTITKEVLSDFLVNIPEYEEQTKIGNLFKQLDTLITQHQTQLKKLNNIKQACLEKMFV